MKYQSIAVAVATLASSVSAFPTLADQVLQGGSLEETAARMMAKRQGGSGIPDNTKTFDPKTQYVSTSGVHAYKAPTEDDQRGPCPGLNAMANHGYLPHNGVGNHLQFIQGTYEVFGMAPDLSGFLTVLGATIDGDGLSWSIGGPSKALDPITIGGLLGQPQGISGSHNKYESDVSPGRGDLYQAGDDFTLQMDRYQALYDMGIANNDEITLAILSKHRSNLFDQSIAKNPYFFNGPFTGVLVQPAAYSFIYRFMSNKSAEHPAGKLNTEILNSFFGVKKNADGSLTKLPGQERIPENWYKRAVGDEYSIPYLNTDTVLAATQYPKFLDVGGNTGKVNTFAGLDLDNLTGGVYNTKNLLEGDNLACFASQFAQQVAPDLIRCSSVLGDITSALTGLNSQIATSFASLSCPKLTKPLSGQFTKFPGYSNLNCKTGQYK
ncbi:hypothetical protein FH972_023218 [Carpinus fangiana]|uniref:Heme haloperoxidase family profile domain-containing protein n=1 Tax=Carpinus fangiana TaxID=176857 RepID=A0A5N6KUT3_9ROSI|nr:hypothetical protein FH972_023218 [Carpinus fangiana]